jgi:CheY-like chemotaxis protein
MTGAEMARLVRATPGIDRTPIVMLTSVDQSLSNSSYRDIAIDAQLIKPARSSALLEAVVGAIQKARSVRDGDPQSEAAAPAAPPIRLVPKPMVEEERRGGLRAESGAPHRVDILVAEDNEVNQLVFTQILAETGLGFEIVSNGRKAVEAYKAMNPRMILMDVSMPEMNGLEATRTIRGLEESAGHRVPIVGVTAHALKGDRERCLEAGMDDYLSKPISPKALLDKVERWMQAGAAGQRNAG